MAATPTAAHKSVIKVDLTATAATLIETVNTVSFGQERTVLDVTNFTLDDRKKILGLKSGTMTLSGFKDKADAGQVILDGAHDSGADVYVRLELGGATNGFEITTKVAGIDISPDVDGIVPVTYNLEITVDSSGNSVVALS